MGEAGVDLLFLQPSSDLEYLTGVERPIPTFGQSQYAHGWVAGAFFRPGRDPVFVLPRMMTLFDLAGELPGEVVVVSERDDGSALFEAAAVGMGDTRKLAVGDRVWAETVLHLTDALAPERHRHRLGARERASADEVTRGARGHGARLPRMRRRDHRGRTKGSARARRCWSSSRSWSTRCGCTVRACRPSRRTSSPASWAARTPRTRATASRSKRETS